MREKWKRSCTVDLLFLSSHFLEEKERNKDHFYKGLPPILAAVAHSLPSLSLNLFTFSQPQGPSQPLASFCCLQQTAVNCCPYQETALAVLKASSAQAETSTTGSPISVAPPLVQRPRNKEGGFIWLSSHTGIDPIQHLLYQCHKLRCTTNRLQRGEKETNYEK